MISLVDTHCHIDLPEYADDRLAVMARALASGVHALVVIGFSPERWTSAAGLQREHPWVRRTIGLHPNDAVRWSDELRDALVTELAVGDALAVGEIGLDFFRERADPETQRRAFAAQVALARDHGLPIVIHQRSAEREVLDVLGPFAPLRGVMHCFSGEREFAERCLALGLDLGIGGVITYPKSQPIRDALAGLSLDRLVLETDAPYLAPQRLRGKRNEPANVVDVLAVLAEITSASREEVALATSDTAERLFGPSLASARRAGMEAAACA